MNKITIVCLQLAFAFAFSVTCLAQEKKPDLSSRQTGELASGLELVFEDDFSEDRRSEYDISGTHALKWQLGKLVVGKGVFLKRELNVGPWVKIELEVEWPETAGEKTDADIQIWFDMDGATDCFVRLARTQNDEQWEIAIALIDTVVQDGKTVEGLVREANSSSLPQELVIEYRHGLVTITNGTQQLLTAHIPNQAAEVAAVRLASRISGLNLTSLLVSAQKRVAQSFSAAEQRELDAANQADRELLQHYQKGDFSQAVVLGEEILEIRQRILGIQHPDYATSLNNLAAMHQAIGDYDHGEPLYVQALEIQRRVLGETHPEYAATMDNLASLYFKMGDYDRAELLYRKTLEIRKQALGDQHPDYATTLSSLASLYRSKGEFGRAEPLCIRTLEIQRQVQGEQHPDYATTLGVLANLYTSMGDFERAEPLYFQILNIQKTAIGEKHPDYAICLNNLAFVFQSRGEFDRAEPLYVQALEIQENALGEQHPDYAISLNNLAGLYRSTGDSNRAAASYIQALEIQKSVLGEQHPEYASSLENLAVLYFSTEDYDRAETLLVQALEIRKRVLGEQHPEYASSLDNLAVLYFTTDDYDRAETLLVQAMEIRKQALKENHPDFATSLNNLAFLYYSIGDYDRAEKLFVRTLNIRKSELGEQHPDYANSCVYLAALYVSKKDYDRAEPLLIHTLEVSQYNFERYSIIQTEKNRQEFAKICEHRLSAYLSTSLKLNNRVDAVWNQASRWKGMSLIRQKRNMQLARLPETRDTFEELRSIRSQMSKHFRTDPTQEGWRQRRDSLKDQEERTERNLTRIIAELDLDVSNQSEYDVKLPERSSLVDFRRFIYSEPDLEQPGEFISELRYLALIRQPDDGVVMLDLGSAERIEALISRWRVPIEAANRNQRQIDTVGQKAMDQAGRELRKILWEPLEAHVTDSEIVIVSPDSALGRFPLIALPGKQPGTYLLEEKKIVYLPVPLLLRELLDHSPYTIDRNSNALLVGNVDYGARLQNSTPDLLSYRNRSILQELKFGRLPASATELKEIAQLFDQAGMLSERSATEQAFQQKAPAFSILHIATHGFFQSPDRFMKNLPSEMGESLVALQEQAKVLTENPNMLSGLAFANANSASSKQIDESGNDGILYSAEIAMLPLEDVELAVLSACETSLGTDDNPGEGLIGIQRAFQVAGAKTTVASYWKVNDQATQMLMNRFYQNLIEYGKQGRSSGGDLNSTTVRIDALRDAQLWMLRGLNRNQVAQLTRGVDDETVLRDVRRVEPDNANSDQTEYISHPRYWAAFVLSGDWR